MNKGEATNIWAKTTAVVVNGMVNPMDSRPDPINPLRPKAISIATPATTGGNINGSSTRLSTVLAHMLSLLARR